MAEAVRKSSPALIAVTWVVVIVPLLWGLTFTVQNALKIFARPVATAPVHAHALTPIPASTPAPR